ncbi:serine-type D-Ala-D-Ala carboxypeptidase (penicillin-binding protein 5/6) [Azospirillaceae bacterium]
MMNADVFCFRSSRRLAMRIGGGVDGLCAQHEKTAAQTGRAPQKRSVVKVSSSPAMKSKRSASIFRSRASALRGTMSEGGARRWATVAFAALLTFMLSALLSAEARAAKMTAIVVESPSGRVIFQNNPDLRNYPASLTKMMTLYLAFEAIDDGKFSMRDELSVSQHAENQAPSKLGVAAGETLRMEHAILGLVTKSANDAAVVLSEAIGGSERQFAEMMTRKARELGMSQTVFRNASGLPNDEQFSTVRDMSRLAQALIRDWPQYYHYFSRQSFTYAGRIHANHNHLMRRYPGMDGLKTGYIRASGFNLAASAMRHGHRLIGVVFGGASRFERDDYMAKILDDGFKSIGATRDDDDDSVERPAPQVSDVGHEDDDDDDNEANHAAKAQQRAVAKSTPPVLQAAADSNANLAAAQPQSGWGVLIGAFSNRNTGRDALSQAARRLPKPLKAATPRLVEVKTERGMMFRAQLSGLRTEQDARSACATVRIKGQKCVPLAPGRS